MPCVLTARTLTLSVSTFFCSTSLSQTEAFSTPASALPAAVSTHSPRFSGRSRNREFHAVSPAQASVAEADRLEPGPDSFGILVHATRRFL